MPQTVIISTWLYQHAPTRALCAQHTPRTYVCTRSVRLASLAVYISNHSSDLDVFPPSLVPTPSTTHPKGVYDSFGQGAYAPQLLGLKLRRREGGRTTCGQNLRVPLRNPHTMHCGVRPHKTKARTSVRLWILGTFDSDEAQSSSGGLVCRHCATSASESPRVES